VVAPVRVDETSRLPSVDVLVEEAVEEGVVHTGQPREAARVRTVLTVADLLTGQYVSP
jgi:hypothetical protein